jgi:hypothetical protein
MPHPLCLQVYSETFILQPCVCDGMAALEWPAGYVVGMAALAWLHETHILGISLHPHMSKGAIWNAMAPGHGFKMPPAQW